MGNSSSLAGHGQRSIETLDGMINNVLYVPNFPTNLFSIYQIANFGSGEQSCLLLILLLFVKLRIPHKLLP
jgi:hypothetical protein